MDELSMVKAEVAMEGKENMHLDTTNLQKKNAMVYREPKELPFERSCYNAINLIDGLLDVFL